MTANPAPRGLTKNMTLSAGRALTLPGIAIVIGTRAQMVKMAPVMRALQDADIDYWFLQSGQHRETFDDLRREFGVKPPDAEAVNTKDDAKSLFLFGGWSLRAARALLMSRRKMLPMSGGIVLVHGDTASTVWGALLGRLTGNAVLHVESGLRSFRITHPFPEEIFRLATFSLASAYACPDDRAIRNLAAYRGEKINLGGNTLYDAFRRASDAKDLPKPDIPSEAYGVISIHRFETLYSHTRLQAVVACILAAAQRYAVLVVAHPPLVHRLKSTGLLETLNQAAGVRLISRMPYFPFITLLRRSTFVVTDGGSNQEELAYLGKPTLILRKASERHEGLGANAILAPLQTSSVVDFLDHLDQYKTSPLSYDQSPTTRLINWLQDNHLHRPQR